MSKQRMWVMLVGADDLWHTSKTTDQTQTRCGLPCVTVRRVSNAAPPMTNACSICVEGVARTSGHPAQGQGVGKKKLPKAVRKKAEELRNQA